MAIICTTITPLNSTALSQDDIEEKLFELVSLYSDGSNQLENGVVKVFFSNLSAEECNRIVCNYFPSEIYLINSEEVKETNWTQRSDELLQPIKAGKIKIIPVNSADDPKINKSKRKDVIYIIPGMGFGTGHHATTKSIIEVIQNDLINSHIQNALIMNPNVADFGTGSGILAIAVANLLTKSIKEIYAFDNDSAAIDNAIENASLNSNLELINFAVADKITGKYGLIIANIYAEVLCEVYESLNDSLIPGGVLIMSGIMETKIHLIKERFLVEQSKNWILLNEQINNSWATVTLQKGKD
jgi:ribosomal protein L11 methyltransferase